MTYAQKLKDPRWKARRLQILKSHNHKCAHCGATEHLEVHHLNYKKGREPWEYNDRELMCLCRKCHELVEVSAIPDLRDLVAIVPGWVLFGMCFSIERAVQAIRSKGAALTEVEIFEEAARQTRAVDTVRKAIVIHSSKNSADCTAIADEIRGLR